MNMAVGKLKKNDIVYGNKRPEKINDYYADTGKR